MDEPVFIVGVKGIARAIGFDQKSLRSSFLGRNDFPARKRGGRWIVTKARLIKWADTYLDAPPEDDTA